MSTSVYEIVTNQIIALLEKQEIPWRKPWKASGPARNLISRRVYNGINQFLLNCSPFSSPYWLTFKQAKDKGGHIRKGERSQLIVFWKWINTVDQPSEEIQDTEHRGKLTKIPILRYYQIFNWEQTSGIPHPPQEEVIHQFTPIEKAEQIIENMPNRPDIQHGGGRACYSPMLDYVRMPEPEAFHLTEEYYSTLFHELSHSTGHQSRLARKGILEPSYFGSHERSQEELVAEFGASMLCGYAGIEQATLENSAAYIQGWLKVLKGDKKLCVLAASQAQKAANYILNIKEDTDPDIAD